MRSKQGSYPKGEHRKQAILDAALNILIDNGYHNFSLRRVASRAGISVGNLQYYFPSKQSLITALLDDIITPYLQEFEGMRAGADPDEQFEKILRLVFTDLQDQRTTIVFPELWSLANHEAGVSGQLDHMYERYRSVMAEIIYDMNPSLGKSKAAKLAVFFSATVEGHTIFVGYDKPMSDEIDEYIEFALKSFRWLIYHG
jgi:AcrR family transcriptional regulator